MQWTEPKLLIADDDVDFRESLAEAFQRRGCLTQLAADGREAVDIVQSACDLHLVLLDVHMPRLSGLEALEQIRELAKNSLPCILMSAQLDEEIVQRAQRLRTSSLLSKPFRLRDLTGTVAEILLQSYGFRM